MRSQTPVGVFLDWIVALRFRVKLKSLGNTRLSGQSPIQRFVLKILVVLLLLLSALKISRLLDSDSIKFTTVWSYETLDLPFVKMKIFPQLNRMWSILNASALLVYLMEYKEEFLELYMFFLFYAMWFLAHIVNQSLLCSFM